MNKEIKVGDLCIITGGRNNIGKIVEVIAYLGKAKIMTYKGDSFSMNFDKVNEVDDWFEVTSKGTDLKTTSTNIIGGYSGYEYWKTFAIVKSALCPIRGNELEDEINKLKELDLLS